ncbi:hypothetical protein GJ496_004629 [Pomphorhynchus laevis]|nr:hypothetical protein GJ496_004629 [Pomphorhynchus laevis]
MDNEDGQRRWTTKIDNEDKCSNNISVLANYKKRQRRCRPTEPSSASVSRISLNPTKGSDKLIPKSICNQINRDKKCEDLRVSGSKIVRIVPDYPSIELQNIYATYILNTFPIPRYPRSLTGHNVHSTVVRNDRLIRSSRRKNVEQCCSKELQTIKPCYVLLEYYTVIFCEFRESGSPFSETFVPAKSDTSANVNETTNTLVTFTNPYEATDTSDTFTNANETKDLLNIECETRVIRFWRNRMIKLGLGIEDDADELLDSKGDTATDPADES